MTGVYSTSGEIISNFYETFLRDGRWVSNQQFPVSAIERFKSTTKIHCVYSLCYFKGLIIPVEIKLYLKLGMARITLSTYH